MKSSARHGETFQAYCNMGTDNLKRYVVVAASQTYLPVCRIMVALNDKEDDDCKIVTLDSCEVDQSCTYCTYLYIPVHNILHLLNFGVF